MSDALHLSLNGHDVTTAAVDDGEEQARLDAVIRAQEKKLIPPALCARYEKSAGKQWTAFYRRNKDNFYKDRHYLVKLMPEAYEANAALGKAGGEDGGEESKKNADAPLVLELGCGAGNTLLPLMEDLPHLRFAGIDFAATGIELIRKREEFDSQRCQLFVGDVSRDPLPESVRNSAVDFATLLFVFSAMKPADHEPVLRKIYDALKPGGLLYFRDYAKYDAAQVRFKAGSKMNAHDDIYVRQDGTMSYFFTREYLQQLLERVGFAVVSNVYHRRTIVNRKTGAEMKRIWSYFKALKKKQTEQ